jgi:predicted RNA-binding Zn-ribbon protein involved in translation (DUF1610 family)
MSSTEIEINPETVGAKHLCPNCDQTFTEKSSLNRHIRKQICTTQKPSKMELIEYVNMHRTTQFVTEEYVKSQDAKMAIMMAEINGLKTQIGQLPDTLLPVINNQNLSILCLGSNDNLLDMMSASEGLPLALTFLKSCALSRLAGDCRILERVYKLDTTQAAIQLINKSKSKYVYYDERQRRTVESNAKVLAKKLTAILQR